MMIVAAKWIARWASLAFVFHLVWEFAHLPLYGLWSDDGRQRIVAYVLHCTVGDVLIATSVFLGTAAVFKRLDWLLQTPWLGGALMAAAGLAYTVFSEWSKARSPSDTRWTEPRRAAE